MKEAINKAIEGGWRKDFQWESVEEMLWLKEKFLLDPLFWQALGKAMGWKPNDPNISHATQSGMERCSICLWHRFISHLAEGKDAESFFNELLK